MADQSASSAGPRVAFQGELGAFSEEAVHCFFGPGVEPVPRRDFEEVGRSVLEGEVDFGLLPIENSLAGSVVGSYDVLATGECEIVGEVINPIHHCVLGVKGSSLDGVRRILSHPVALMQCTKLLSSLPGVEAVAAYDTAGAAKDVADLGDPTQAAIAGKAAAQRYGLVVLAEDVEDRPDNQTRFLVVRPKSDAEAARPKSTQAGDTMKTAVMVETRNVPGALLQVLSPFAQRGINLSKLESRPAGEPWSYRFFMEVDTDAQSASAKAAFDEIGESSVRLQILGTYPKWELR